MLYQEIALGKKNWITSKEKSYWKGLDKKFGSDMRFMKFEYSQKKWY